MRERFRTRSGAIKSVLEYSWRLLEESGEFLDGRPRLGFIPGLEIDRRPGIIEEELRSLFRCEASVVGWRETTVSALAFGSDPGDGHSASVGLACDSPKHRWRSGSDAPVSRAAQCRVGHLGRDAPIAAGQRQVAIGRQGQPPMLSTPRAAFANPVCSAAA